MTIGITIDDVVERTQRLVYGVHWPAMDELGAAITTTTATSITGTWVTDVIRAGAFLGIDYEDLWVPVAPSGTTITVRRGQRGTTAATHLIGAQIEVDPRFSKARILEEVKDEVRSWPRGLYAVGSVELSAASGDNALDLTGASALRVLRALSIRRSPRSGDEGWPKVDGTIVPRQNTTDFPSGYAVELYGVTESSTVRVSYAYDFDVDSFSPSDDLETYGLSVHMADIIQWGVAWRLLAADEASRTDDQAQGRSRSAEEVPVSARLRASAYYKGLRDDRIAAEQLRLLDEFGWGYRSR